MIRFNENFIGCDPNVTVEFAGGDQSFMYEKNLAEQPDDWYYRFNKITYQYNSLGHRCKNIEDIDLDNYLLFTGCSHAEGVGLELEKTFPYIISEQLGMDYYNLALGGSGIDIMTYNLMMWLNTVKKLPKALIVLWPSNTRFALNDGEEVSLVNVSSDNEDHLRFLALGTDIGYFDSVRSVSERLINTCFNDTTVLNTELWALERFDLARDLAHAGIISNAYLAKKLIRQLK